MVTAAAAASACLEQHDDIRGAGSDRGPGPRAPGRRLGSVSPGPGGLGHTGTPATQTAGPGPRRWPSDTAAANAGPSRPGI